MIQPLYNHVVPALCCQLCDNLVATGLCETFVGQSCDKFDIPVKLVRSCQQLVPNLMTTWDKQHKHNMFTDFLQVVPV